MSIKAALHEYLASKASVTNLVPADRIVRGKRPAGTPLPCVTYSRPSWVDDNHQGGSSGKVMNRIQLDIWGTSDGQVDTIRAALRNVLHGLQHTTIGTGDNATAVECGLCENATDSIEWPEDGTDPARFSCSIDWVVYYETAIPDFM